MSPVKQRLLSAMTYGRSSTIEQAPDFQLEKLLMILEFWKGDGPWSAFDHRMIQSEQDANHSGIHETEYLLSIPGMRESILEGMATPIQDCNRELEW